MTCQANSNTWDNPFLQPTTAEMTCSATWNYNRQPAQQSRTTTDNLKLQTQTIVATIKYVKQPALLAYNDRQSVRDNMPSNH